MADLSDVMDALSDAVSGIDGLRAHPYYSDSLTPPCAIAGWPEELTYDATFGRGSDSCVMPLIVAVGRADARSSRDRLAKYAAGSGPHSVKQAVEEFETEAWMSARVESAEFGAITVASISYLSVTFNVAIALRGGEVA